MNQGNERPSDLEIVQKALDKNRASIEIWSTKNERWVGVALDSKSLIKWAKHAIEE